MKLAYMVVTPDVRAFPFAWLGQPDEVLPAIADLGYTGVEIQVCDPRGFDRSAFRERLRQYRLEPVALGSGPMGRQDGLYLIHSREEIRREALERYRALIDLAAEWRVPAAIGRGRGLLSDAPSRDVGLQWWREALDQILEHAEQRDVMILLEPQNRYNADFLITIDETIELLDSLGSDLLSIEADTYHQALEERSIVASYVRAEARLGHIQLADSNRLAPGRGNLNWVDILETISAIGYGGWLSMEIHQEPDPGTAARASINVIQSLLS